MKGIFIMLDNAIFGEKLRQHRLNLGLTQQTVAEKLGISAQAVSKWENGECLPDCFNLKAIGELYGISLDILMETETAKEIDVVSRKLEQIADEFIWTKQKRDRPNAHYDLGHDLWEMWKGIFFIEVGNKQKQIEDKARGNLRVCSEYGLKIWDDDGIACVIQSAIKDKFSSVSEHELDLMRDLCSAEGFKLISLLDTTNTITKEDLLEKSGLDPTVVNELLLKFIENRIIEFAPSSRASGGYKLCGHYGIAAYMILSAAYILSKKVYTVSEYIPH